MSEQPTTAASGRATLSPAPKPARPKVGRTALACLGYAILFLAVIAAGLAIFVAKTGIVTIPLASRLYRGPQPTRIVTADAEDPQKFYDKLSLQVTALARAGEKPPYRVILEESELTAAVKGALAELLGKSGVAVERPQLAVMPEYLEFSGRFIRSGLRLDTLARFRPVVSKGELTFDFTKTELGDFAIPTSTARSLIGLAVGRDLGSWRLEIGPVGLSDIRLMDGKVELLLTPK